MKIKMNMQNADISIPKNITSSYELKVVPRQYEIAAQFVGNNYSSSNYIELHNFGYFNKGKTATEFLAPYFKNFLETVSYVTYVDIPCTISTNIAGVIIEAVIVTVANTVFHTSLTMTPIPTVLKLGAEVAISAVLHLFKGTITGTVKQACIDFGCSEEITYGVNSATGAITGAAKYYMKTVVLEGKYSTLRSIQGAINGYSYANDPDDKHIVRTETIDAWKDIADVVGSKSNAIYDIKVAKPWSIEVLKNFDSILEEDEWNNIGGVGIIEGSMIIDIIKAHVAGHIANVLTKCFNQNNMLCLLDQSNADVISEQKALPSYQNKPDLFDAYFSSADSSVQTIDDDLSCPQYEIGCEFMCVQGVICTTEHPTVC